MCKIHIRRVSTDTVKVNIEDHTFYTQNMNDIVEIVLRYLGIDYYVEDSGYITVKYKGYMLHYNKLNIFIHVPVETILLSEIKSYILDVIEDIKSFTEDVEEELKNNKEIEFEI